jgi:hypothetical protein
MGRTSNQKKACDFVKTGGVSLSRNMTRCQLDQLLRVKKARWLLAVPWLRNTGKEIKQGAMQSKQPFNVIFELEACSLET